MVVEEGRLKPNENGIRKRKKKKKKMERKAAQTRALLISLYGLYWKSLEAYTKILFNDV